MGQPRGWQCNVICPFYRRDSRAESRIFCEGPVADSGLSLHFDRAGGKTDWMLTYCTTWEYQQCPVAAAAAGKYDKEASL